MSLLIRYPLLAPPDSIAGSPEQEETTKNFLLADDDEEAIDVSTQDAIGEGFIEEDGAEDKQEISDEAEESEAPTLEDEIQEQLEEPAEEKLEASIDPPTRRQILEQFPDLFKKIPYLEKAMYREQKYTELLPTIADAQSAVEKSQALDNFSNQLLQGDLAQVFQYAADQDKNAFYKLVDNMMLDLGSVDEGAQVHVIANVGKHLIQQMWNAGASGNDETLKAAAHILNQFITGQKVWVPPAKLSREDDPQQNQLQQERQQLYAQRFTAVREDLISTLDKRIQNTLDKNIDPNGSMTEFTKNAAITEAKRQIQTAIKSDTRFRKLMDQAWSKAAKSNYAKESTDLLKKSYSNKTQLILPGIIKNVRNQALRGYKRSAGSDVKTNIREPQKRGPAPVGNSAPQSRGKQSASKTPPAGGVKNFLMSDE